MNSAHARWQANAALGLAIARRAYRSWVSTLPGRGPRGRGQLRVGLRFSAARSVSGSYQARTSVLLDQHCNRHRTDIGRRFPDVSGDYSNHPGVISAPSFSQRIRRSRSTPIALSLVTALTLVARLGYEAVSSATSHRRTTEALLRDYVLVSATQFTGFLFSELDEVIDEMLVPVARSRDITSPAVVAMRM